MTEREKILREGLVTLKNGNLTKLQIFQIARETIAKSDAVPHDLRLPDYLKDDPWALQMLDYVDGLKADADK